jgi:hypothetical protein
MEFESLDLVRPDIESLDRDRVVGLGLDGCMGVQVTLREVLRDVYDEGEDYRARTISRMGDATRSKKFATISSNF